MKQSDNEDCAGIIQITDEQLVLALADGVGGQPAGKHASRLAIDALKEAIPGSLEGNGTLREAVLSGFDNANQAVIGAWRRRGHDARRRRDRTAIPCEATMSGTRRLWYLAGLAS